MQIGDLVMTKRGNLALVTGVYGENYPYCDLLFCSTGHHRTGFHFEGIVWTDWKKNKLFS